MTFPDLKERYLEKEDERVTRLTRGTGGLCSSDGVVQRRGHVLDMYSMHCYPDRSGFLGMRRY